MLTGSLLFTGIVSVTTLLAPETSYAIKSTTKNFKKNKIEAESWGDANFSTWINELSPDEKSTIKSYTGSGYQDINNYLIENKGALATNTKLNAKIQTLDQALDKAYVPEDITVYRRVTESHFGIDTDVETPLRAPGQNQINRDVLRKLESKFYGKTFTQDSYMSTSLSQDPDENSSFKNMPILFRIAVDAGTHAGFIDALSGYGQVELLLKRGYTFRYEGFTIEENENGRESMVVDLAMQ